MVQEKTFEEIRIEGKKSLKRNKKSIDKIAKETKMFLKELVPELKKVDDPWLILGIFESIVQSVLKSLELQDRIRIIEHLINFWKVQEDAKAKNVDVFSILKEDFNKAKEDRKSYV